MSFVLRPKTPDQLTAFHRRRLGCQQRPGRHQARLTCASSSSGDVAGLEAAKVALAQNLAAKEAEWKAGATQGASVTSAGGDGASLPLVEVNKDTFYPALEAAGDALVVVDFMTDWCGPCKLMAPKLAAWHGELAPAVQFLKFNCNKDNAVLGKALGIKVAPTFHLYRAGKQLAVLTGAKEEALRELIDEHRGNSITT